MPVITILIKVERNYSDLCACAFTLAFPSFWRPPASFSALLSFTPGVAPPKLRKQACGGSIFVPSFRASRAPAMRASVSFVINFVSRAHRRRANRPATDRPDLATAAELVVARRWGAGKATFPWFFERAPVTPHSRPLYARLGGFDSSQPRNPLRPYHRVYPSLSFSFSPSLSL